MFCFVNNELVKRDEAVIGISDLSIIRGYGIFDFFRLRDSIPLFMEEHLDRFFMSAGKVFDKVPFDKIELEGKVKRLIELNQMPVSGIRIVLTGGYSPDGYSTATPNLIITQENITFPPDKSYNEGVKLITYPYLRELPDVKTINYMTGIWLKKEITKAGAFDVLYHNNGHVCELTRSNFFIVNEKGEVLTPGHNILKGVTRRKVLDIASGVVKIHETPIPVDDLKIAREAFLTGTTKKILPVTQIDNFTIGDGKPGPVTKELMRQFNSMEEDFIARRI